MPHEQQPVTRDQEGHEKVIHRIAAQLRTPVPVDPAFEMRVMAAVRSEARVTLPHLFSSRRPMRFWAVGVGLAAAVVMTFVIADRMHGHMVATSAVARMAAADGPARVLTVAPRRTSAGRGEPARWMVRFTFVAQTTGEIHDVALAGSFNDWDTSVIPLRPIGHGRWVADVPLRPGRYVYQFVINGKQWIPDPQAPRDASTDFGTSNSVITVAEGGIT